MKPVQYFFFLFSLKSLVKKKFFTIQKQQKKIIVNCNFQKNFCKIFYHKRPDFPNLKRDFKASMDFSSTENNKENFLSLLSSKNDLSVHKPSLQLILVLKNLKFIETNWENRLINISKSGLKIFFKTPGKQLIETFRKLDLVKKKYCNKISNPFKGCYKNFEQKIFRTQLSVFGKNFKLEGVLKKSLDLFNRLNWEIEKKIKIMHCFCNINNENFPLFHEIGFLYFPRLTDGIFFSKKGSYEKKNPPNLYSKVDKGFISKSKFHIVIESNYRIYVYKKKSLSNKIFTLFSESFYELPRLFVGEITEKSITSALKKGITSSGILTFIETNLHKICPTIPPTVSDQIKVWEFQKRKNLFSNSIVFRNSGKNSIDLTELSLQKKPNMKIPKIGENLILLKT